MYEVHEIVGAVLFGSLGLYLIAFWGTAIFAWVWGSYVHDGEKEVWSVPLVMVKEYEGDLYTTMYAQKAEFTITDVYVWYGIVYPFLSLCVAAIVWVLTLTTGMLVPYLFMGILTTWLSLYILRSVVRLNKKLDKHESNKDAHK